MKKITAIILTVLIILTLGGCAARDKKDENLKPGQNQGKSPGENQPIAVVYKDGTYTAEGDPWQYGKEDATVIIKGGKITDITLRRLDTNGKEVNYNDWTGQTKDNKTYPNLKQYRVDMAKRMIDAQSSEVDTISGATVSTNNWKLAVRRALEKATK